MTRGLGGCGPMGLAAAAARRGMNVLVVQSAAGIPFLHSVRSPEKREVIRIVHEQNRDEADRLGVARYYGRFDVPLVRALLERRVVPIVLISLYRLYGTKEPHWVVVTGYDGRNVYFHDPYAPIAGGSNGLDIPVSVPEFRSMRRYGKDLSKMLVALADHPIDMPSNVLPSGDAGLSRSRRVIGSAARTGRVRSAAKPRDSKRR